MDPDAPHPDKPPAHLAPTHENVQEILMRSDIRHAQMCKKTTVICCKLPNGYEIVVSSAPIDTDDFDDQRGKDACISKLRDKVIELLAFQQHGELE